MSGYKITDSRQCRTQKVEESWASVIFRKAIKPHFNPVGWSNGGWVRAFTVFFYICLFHNCETFP